MAALFLQLPAMILSVVREHKQVCKLVKLFGIRLVISDNRYGLYCRDAHTVIVTHQLSPVLPGLLSVFEYPLYLVIRAFINRFDECWIPDLAGIRHNYSGKLSHRFTLPVNARFIGLLSRFDRVPADSSSSRNPVYDLAVVMSGPEPQLGIFCKMVWQQAARLPVRTIIIGGMGEAPPETEKEDGTGEYVKWVPHLSREHFKAILENAGMIICRAGYSGISDLAILKRTALLVPTPGQPEQEYLARYLSDKGRFHAVAQHRFELGRLYKEYSKHGAEADDKTR
jgi:hypothetical protein